VSILRSNSIIAHRVTSSISLTESVKRSRAEVSRYSYILPGQSNGTFHGNETLLLFGVPVPADPAVADNVVDLWTRFAKTEHPNGGMDVTWPNCTRKNGRYLEINVTPMITFGE